MSYSRDTNGRVSMFRNLGEDEATTEQRAWLQASLARMVPILDDAPSIDAQYSLVISIALTFCINQQLPIIMATDLMASVVKAVSDIVTESSGTG